MCSYTRARLMAVVLSSSPYFSFSLSSRIPGWCFRVGATFASERVPPERADITRDCLLKFASEKRERRNWAVAGGLRVYIHRAAALWKYNQSTSQRVGAGGSRAYTLAFSRTRESFPFGRWGREFRGCPELSWIHLLRTVDCFRRLYARLLSRLLSCSLCAECVFRAVRERLRAEVGREETEACGMKCVWEVNWFATEVWRLNSAEWEEGSGLESREVIIFVYRLALFERSDSIVDYLNCFCGSAGRFFVLWSWKYFAVMKWNISRDKNSYFFTKQVSERFLAWRLMIPNLQNLIKNSKIKTTQ